MNDSLIQYVLAAGSHNSESLVDVLIVVVFIVIWVIRVFVLGQNKQGGQQQKRTVSHQRPAQRTPLSSQKAQAQKDRVEKFLESILQPKKMAQQHPARPVMQKPQMTSIPAQAVPQKISSEKISPVPDKVYVGKPAAIVNTTIKQPSKEILSSEEALGISITDLPTIDTTINSNLEHIPELKEEHIQEDQRHLIYHKEMQSYKGKSTSFLPALSDYDELKRAILYTEILGKPVSTRESQSIY